jgi:hypothetical protein
MQQLRHVYDQGVRRFTRNKLSMDQFNIAFNTPGFESHARLADSEMEPFLEQAADYIGTTMLGYGLWGYKDYHHNLLYNPRFQVGLTGWSYDGRGSLAAQGGRTPAGCKGQPERPCEHGSSVQSCAATRVVRLGVECYWRHAHGVGRRRAAQKFRLECR